MHLCPFCKSRVHAPLPEHQLTPKRRKVYDLIVEAGPEGIPVSEVMEKLYPGGSNTSLRTAISYINKAIAPDRIRRKNHRYAYQLLEGD